MNLYQAINNLSAVFWSSRMYLLDSASVSGSAGPGHFHLFFFFPFVWPRFLFAEVLKYVHLLIMYEVWNLLQWEKLLQSSCTSVMLGL